VSFAKNNFVRARKNQNNMKYKIIFLLFSLWLSASIIAAPPLDEGKSIFAARCAACHNINKNLTGPALAGVDQRRSIDWIISFVQSSQTMVKSGNKDAVALFHKFNNIPMPDHADLSDAQIKNIVEYIKTEAKPVEEEKAPFATPSKLRPNYNLPTLHSYSFFIAFFALVALLIAVLLFAVRVKEYERKMAGSE
jgi:mono/diheme cytochrome c family protein